MSPTDRALILDVDGVVSQVKGHTAFGDDIEAGHVFGPVLVSPAMCRRLDELAHGPEIECAWLTSWSREMRQAMNPFPGPDWPDVPPAGGLDNDGGWWKWNALWAWLLLRPQLTRLAWCDDYLTDEYLAEVEPKTHPQATGHHSTRIGDPTLYGPAAIRADLATRGIAALLVAPRTDRGLTPEHIQRLERFLTQ